MTSNQLGTPAAAAVWAVRADSEFNTLDEVITYLKLIRVDLLKLLAWGQSAFCRVDATKAGRI